MGFDPAVVEMITFDSYATLFDVSSASRAVEDHIDDSEADARKWRRWALEYSSRTSSSA